MVPVSAITGEGIPDLFKIIIGLTQKFMKKKITFDADYTKCIVLEVRKLEGVGTILDVILSNGVLNCGDNILVLTDTGCIRTQINRIYAPKSMKEIRIKGELDQYDTIYASFGAKIYADNINNAIAGFAIHVINNKTEEEINAIETEMTGQLDEIVKYTSDEGVYVQTSSLGSLDGLNTHLRQNKIPISGMNLGQVNKRDVLKVSIKTIKSENFYVNKYGVILAFDVAISKDAEELAKEQNIIIFQGPHIYNLVDEYKAYIKSETTKMIEKIKKMDDFAIPCELSIISEKHIFRESNPILVGVKVERGQLVNGSIICIKMDTVMVLGKIDSIQLNGKNIDAAIKEQEVCIRIPASKHKLEKKNYNHKNKLFTRLSLNMKNALSILKDEFTIDWKLVK